MGFCLEKHLLGNGNTTRNYLRNIDSRAILIVAIGYVVTMLSVSLFNLAQLLLFAIYPLIMAALSDISYSQLFRKSLIALPFVLFVGVMNPILDHQVVMNLCGIEITAGWVSFLSIVIRGLLSIQALLLLVRTCGFNGVCNALERLGISQILVTQLVMVGRYIVTIADEAVAMSRARQSRGYGRHTYRVKEWGRLVAQLLLRTIERGERVNRAMLARVFSGQVYVTSGGDFMRWGTNSTLFMLIWGGVIFCLRYFNLITLL